MSDISICAIVVARTALLLALPVVVMLSPVGDHIIDVIERIERRVDQWR